MTPRFTDEAHLFVLRRTQDISGVSGTGDVADGVQWPDGRVTIRWRGDHPSTVNWDDIGDALFVHGHAGATKIVWLPEVPDDDFPDPPRIWWDGADFIWLQEDPRQPGFYRAHSVEDITGSEGPVVELRYIPGVTAFAAGGTETGGNR